MIVVFGFDEGFAMPTAVAARSVDRFLAAGDRVVLLHDQVEPATMTRVQSCVENAECVVIDCGRSVHTSWVPSPHITRAAFLRYLAPELLPRDSRCLYLDGDVIVRRSPAELFDIDLAGTTIGAVRSRVAPFAASPGGIKRWLDLGIAGNAPYFNSGVLLMDLDRWRQNDVTGQITRFLERYGDDTYIADQEALNVAVVDDWVDVGRTWNYITHVVESFLQQPEIELDEPSIVHFAGRQKPWTFGQPPMYSDEWYELKATTPWAGFRPTPPVPPRGAAAGVKRLVGQALRGLRTLAREP